MQDHAIDDGVYIRSMATRGHLGGLALATPLAARVLDASGKPWVLIETVGVGQVEVEIAGAADTTIVVVNPGWGDGVQANKAGLLEIADLFVVNKADRDGVAETVRDLEMMLDLTGEMAWRPQVVQTVATRGEGIDELWDAIGEHREFQEQHRPARPSTRGRGCATSCATSCSMRLREQADATLRAATSFEKLVAQVAARELDPYAAAEELLGA